MHLRSTILAAAASGVLLLLLVLPATAQGDASQASLVAIPALGRGKNDTDKPAGGPGKNDTSKPAGGPGKNDTGKLLTIRVLDCNGSAVPGIIVGISSCAVYRGMREDVTCVTGENGTCTIEPGKSSRFLQFCRRHMQTRSPKDSECQIVGMPGTDVGQASSPAAQRQPAASNDLFVADDGYVCDKISRLPIEIILRPFNCSTKPPPPSCKIFCATNATDNSSIEPVPETLAAAAFLDPVGLLSLPTFAGNGLCSSLFGKNSTECPRGLVASGPCNATDPGCGVCCTKPKNGTCPPPPPPECPSLCVAPDGRTGECAESEEACAEFGHDFEPSGTCSNREDCPGVCCVKREVTCPTCNTECLATPAVMKGTAARHEMVEKVPGLCSRSGICPEGFVRNGDDDFCFEEVDGDQTGNICGVCCLSNSPECVATCTGLSSGLAGNCSGVPLAPAPALKTAPVCSTGTYADGLCPSTSAGTACGSCCVDCPTTCTARVGGETLDGKCFDSCPAGFYDVNATCNDAASCGKCCIPAESVCARPVTSGQCAGGSCVCLIKNTTASNPGASCQNLSAADILNLADLQAAIPGFNLSLVGNGGGCRENQCNAVQSSLFPGNDRSGACCPYPCP